MPRRGGGDMQRELVELAQAGDHEAFTVLARASSARMYGIARLILRDSDRAQDAVQEALVSSWRHIRALRDPGSVLALRAPLRKPSQGRNLPVAEDHARRFSPPVKLHSLFAWHGACSFSPDFC